MTDILLLRPPEFYGKSSFAQFYTLHECLGIGYLASYLRSHDQSVYILDSHIEALSVEDTIEKIVQQDCAFLGISIGSSLVMPQVIQIIRELKKKLSEIHITLGGHHPTFCFKQLLEQNPEIDSIVRFEGEEALLELLTALRADANLANVRGIAYRKDGKITTTPIRPLIRKLDALPFPARDTFPKLLERGGLPLISGSRGCPSACSFCSVHSFYNTPPGKIWRSRSIKNILEEIKLLEKEYGCHELWFVDDNFFGFGKHGIRRARDFFEALEKADVDIIRLDFACRADTIAENPDILELIYGKRHGLVYLGIEAGVQRILDLYKKGTTVDQNRKAVKAIKESHADIKMEFILFNPWISIDEVKETIRFLEEIDVYDPYILTSTLTIMRQTPLADAIQEGRLKVSPLPLQDLQGFDQESFVPYNITDQNVRALFQIVTAALPQLEYILSAVHDLRQEGQKQKQGLANQLTQSIEESCRDLTQLINITSLDIFKEALECVEKLEFPGDSQRIQELKETLSQKTLKFARSLTGLIQIQKSEFYG